MKSPRNLDPRAIAAIEFQRRNNTALTGPILLRDIIPALPLEGRRRSWSHAVTIFLLCELMGVYRVQKGRDPYWRGPLYQVRRQDLAAQFACDVDDISASLTWLESLGLVEVVRKTMTDDEGVPKGTSVYAIPQMARICSIIDYYKQNGHPVSKAELKKTNPLEGGTKFLSGGSEVSVKSVQSPIEGGMYLNCALTAQNKQPSASHGLALDLPGSSGQLGAGNVKSQAVAGGGGAVDCAAEGAQVRLMEKSSPKEGSNNYHQASASVQRPVITSPEKAKGEKSQEPSTASALPCWKAPRMPADIEDCADNRHAWMRANRFCSIWAQAIQRSGHVDICDPSSRDVRAAFRFFENAPQANSFFCVAVAIVAWHLGRNEPDKGWDRFYHCRMSMDLQVYLRHHATGKILPEIKGHGWEVNAYRDLRMYFTESELRYFGWTKVPTIEVDADELWENDTTAWDFYSDRGLPIPPEVSPITG